MPELKVLETNTDIEALRKYIGGFEFVAMDTETNGLHKGSRVMGISLCAEETKAFYVVNSEQPALRSLIGDLAVKQLICHNGIFDCARIEENFKICLIESLHTDTMLLAHIINENRRVGLKDLAKEYFGADSTKEMEEMKASVIANGGEWSASNKEMWKADPHTLGKYGAQDALLTLKLLNEMLPELAAQGLEKFFYEDESMPLLRGPTYQLNTVGLKVDQDRIASLKKQLEAECLEALDFVHSEIKKLVNDRFPGTQLDEIFGKTKKRFNIGSNNHLAWLLFGKMGLEFDRLTKGGKDVCKYLSIRVPYTRGAKRDFIHRATELCGRPSSPPVTINGVTKTPRKYRDAWAYIQVDKKTLEKIAPKYKWVERLLEYKRKQKLLTTYLSALENKVRYGIISPSFLQHGTTSGRYSSRDPNFQNLPRDDKRIKSCIISRPGRVFVGADYSQLEPRVFAYFSKDPRLLKAFDGTSDFYSTIGMEVYDIRDATPRKDGSDEAFGTKYKKLRDISKVIALASTYGATPFQLAGITGLDVADTEAFIERYFERFPGVKDMMLRAHETAKNTGRVQNLFGRPRRMPDAKRIHKLYPGKAHEELPYEWRNMLNLAVNHTIQSTGASIVNRAAIAACKSFVDMGIDARLIIQVHDSLVFECLDKDAEDVSTVLQIAMEETVQLDGITLEAIPKIGSNLAEV